MATKDHLCKTCSNVIWKATVQGILQFRQNEGLVNYWGRKMIPEKSFPIIGHICLNVVHIGNFNGKVKLINKNMIKNYLHSIFNDFK